MAILDQNALLRCKDENGNEYLLYPITKLECVNGAEDLLHYGAAQELTDAEKIQARENIGALCAPTDSAYKLDKFIKVTAVDDEGRITAVEAVDSETYAHPDAHPASMITGLADVATTGDYMDLRNRPFGTEIVETELIPETTCTFSYDKYEASYMVEDTISEDVVDAWYSGLWDEAIVVWDGVTYPVKRQMIEGIPAVGNFDGTTGEPFMLGVVKADLSGFDGIVIWSLADAAPEDTENAPTIDHTLSISLALETTTKLPEQYQTQVDWNETESDSAALILNRPFGKLANAGIVVVNLTIAYDYSDSAFYLYEFTGTDVVPFDTKSEYIVEGGKYVVKCGDYVYSGVGISGAEALTYIGITDATATSGIKITDESGNHIATYVCGYVGIADFIYVHSEYQSRYENGISYPIYVVTSGDNIKKLDNKYLDILDSNSKNLISSTLVSFNRASSLLVGAISITEEQLTQYMALCADKQSALVTIDGTEYKATLTNELNEDGSTARIIIGDFDGMSTNWASSEEPFVILSDVSTVDDVTTYQWIVFMRADNAPDDKVVENYASHVIRVELDYESYTVKQEFIPRPPEFDLTAMGLPALDAVDGTGVVANCDTTDLMSALGSGSVIISFQINTGEILDATIVGTGLYSLGMYQVTYTAYINDSPMMILLNFGETYIIGNVIKLATALPTVTANDAGKFLRVNSSGEWVAETIENAEEVCF